MGGPVVTLRPRGYQFPGVVSGQPRDWDANWLIIDGRVSAADGRSWRFSDPCLTTWEAAELSGWLRAVAAGVVAPVALDQELDVLDGSGPEEREGLLTFVEPTIAFSLAGPAPDGVELRVHLSPEVRPPQPPGTTFERFGHVVSIRLPRADLISAVEVWDRERAAFPPR